MLEGLYSSDAYRPRSLEAYAGSFSRSQEISERSLFAATGGGDDRRTQISLSQQAFSELRESRIALAGRGGDDAEDFAQGLDRASRRIGRALERFIGRVERLQDRAEQLGELLTQRIRDDVSAGRFEDRTIDRLATRLLSQAGRLENAAERLTDRLESAFEAAGLTRGDDDDAEEAGSALNVSFSQSVSITVQQVNVEIQENGRSVSVSYQKLVIESSTTLGIGLAGDTPAVTDPANPQAGNLPTAAQESGTFVDSQAAETVEALTQATAGASDGNDNAQGGSGDGQGAAVPVPDTGAGLTAGQGALLLIQQVSFEASVTRFSFSAAARTGPFGGGSGAELQASQFDFNQQSTRILSLTA